MCTLESLLPTVLVLSLFKIGAGLYVLVAGALLVESLPIQMAYSVNFVDIGGSLVALGLFSMLTSFPLVYAVKKHNRFLLVVVFCLDTIFMGQLVNLGVRILKYTEIKFPKDLQEDCVRAVPKIYTKEECQLFREDDRTAGFRLIWTYLFSVRENPTQFQIMATIERDSECCGFFSPMVEDAPTTGCDPINLPLPNGHRVEDLPTKWVQSKLSCGAYPGFYLRQMDCVAYYDVSVAPPIVGGCNYDLGIGPCLELDVDDGSMGCASSIEDYSATLIEGTGYGLFTGAFFNFLAMLISCCVWWKRKAEDVFPDFLREEKVNTIKYFNVEHQFTVKPQEHYLQLHGYNPTDERASNFRFVTYVKHDEFVPKGVPKGDDIANDIDDSELQSKIYDRNSDGDGDGDGETINQSKDDEKGFKNIPNDDSTSLASKSIPTRGGSNSNDDNDNLTQS